MRMIDTNIPDIKLIEPQIHQDNRGLFFESFNQAEFEKKIGLKFNFIQDNHSLSRKNVLRGLHYQESTPQAKLIRVVQGEIFDVAVDIRPSSPTYAQWVGVILSAENKLQMWIPEGFAHGFLTLSETSEVIYKVTAPYSPDDECTILWNDSRFKIQWPINDVPILSKKDSTPPQ